MDELDRQLLSFRQRKDELDVEAIELAERRDKLNDKFKALRTEIVELRDARDRANEKVQELKQKREVTGSKALARVEELAKLRQQAKALAKKRPSKNQQLLQKEFEALEWKIQTTSLSIQEDKELVEKVKQIETQLNVHKKIEQLRQKALELQTELKALDVKRKLYHEQLTQIARTSQEVHQKMLVKIAESKKAKTEADATHQQFLQTIEKAKQARESMAALLTQIKQVKGEIYEEELDKKKQSEETLRGELEQHARAKLKRGEKLSWEEFQVLAEKGMGAQD
jgi:uncharacterized coiled-coil DUF342 family protein